MSHSCIRPGDRVRTTALNTVTGAVAIDETTVQHVKAGTPTDKAPDGTPLPPGTVQIHGTAQDFNSPGTPLALGWSVARARWCIQVNRDRLQTHPEQWGASS